MRSYLAAPLLPGMGMAFAHRVPLCPSGKERIDSWIEERPCDSIRHPRRRTRAGGNTEKGERSMARIGAEERRQDFIEATIKVIAEHGVANATTRRIAAAADSPLASLHYVFHTKDELFCAV